MTNIVVTDAEGIVCFIYRNCSWAVRRDIGYVSRFGKDVVGFALNNLDAHTVAAADLPNDIETPVRDAETGEIVSGWQYVDGQFSEIETN